MSPDGAHLIHFMNSFFSFKSHLGHRPWDFVAVCSVQCHLIGSLCHVIGSFITDCYLIHPKLIIGEQCVLQCVNP